MATKYIAHRGFANLQTENTIAAFQFAAKSNAFGIETDVHVTRDGKFVVFHDDNTIRLCGQEYIIEDTDFDCLRGLTITTPVAQIPTLDEYITICKSGNKHAVIELKNPMTRDQIAKLIKEIENKNYLFATTFISFDMNNCLTIREILPHQPVQFITITFEPVVLKQIADKKIDLDIEWTCLSRDRIKQCHDLGIKVNCWTLNDDKIAKHFEKCGIDYITSNNLGV